MAQTTDTNSRLTTTPFRARFRSDDLAAQARARERQMAQNGNASAAYNKWQLLRALTEARAAFGLSDRTITVLEALLSFHPDKELGGHEPIIVFPSNAELSLRTRGMAPATLRRHLAALVGCGLMHRRDSPNGKRFAQRDGTGQVAQAFGFDLAPFALAAPDIHGAAEQARAEALALRRVRATITCHLRDIRAIVNAGLSEREEDADLWSTLADALGALSGRLARNATLADMNPRRAALARLHAAVEEAWLDGLSYADLDGADPCPTDECAPETKQMSVNDVVFERHIQNSKPDTIFDLSQENRQKPRTRPHETDRAERGPEGQRDDLATGNETRMKERRDDTKLATPPLTAVLAICPQIAAYAKGGIENWQGMATAADLVRTTLGVSPSAWQRACAVMGVAGAATVMAAMLERAETIRSPGGYLRTLTDRTEAGQFSLGPMLKALG